VSLAVLFRPITERFADALGRPATRDPFKFDLGADRPIGEPTSDTTNRVEWPVRKEPSKAARTGRKSGCGGSRVCLTPTLTRRRAKPRSAGLPFSQRNDSSIGGFQRRSGRAC